MSSFVGSATLWNRTGTNGYGEPSFSSPVTITCHWEEKVQVMMDNRGEEFVSMGCVFVDDTLVVAIEDYVFNGASSVTNPLTLPRAFKVRQISKIPNYNGQRTEVKLYL